MSRFIKTFKLETKKKDSKFQSMTDDKATFAYVEAYKSLRTNFEFVANQSDVKTVLITSAVPEESKTNVAINLAVSLGKKDKKVVIVDCDLRQPMLHSYLHIDNVSKGLTEFLKENSVIDENIIYLEDLNISIIPAGKNTENPSEILGISKMEALTKELKQKFDYVILDAPPVSVVTDAAVIARVADGVIWVVRSQYASAHTICSAKKKLEDLNIKILGAVVTRYQSYKHKDVYRYYRKYEKENRSEIQSNDGMKSLKD